MERPENTPADHIESIINRRNDPRPWSDGEIAEVERASLVDRLGLRDVKTESDRLARNYMNCDWRNA